MQKSILESDQYSARSIRRYEGIFGKDFISSGGAETTGAICKTLDLKPGTRVLDVGSGLGGSAFHMNRVYGARVTGVDILPQMIALSTERASGYGMDGVEFIEGDILELSLPLSCFDLIYSRDALLYIKDKLSLFQKLHGLLAPGGSLFVSDYACGPEPLSEEFTQYANGAGYHLASPEAYGAVVQEAGFQDVQAQDATELFISVLKGELARIQNASGQAGADLEPEDRDYLVQRWERKVRWCTAGDMRWVHIRALKD